MTKQRLVKNLIFNQLLAQIRSSYRFVFNYETVAASMREVGIFIYASFSVFYKCEAGYCLPLTYRRRCIRLTM